MGVADCLSALTDDLGDASVASSRFPHALARLDELTPTLRGLANPPPYFHQTTEFTCGPACMMMALAWAKPNLQPTPALEFKLWREATTIFMTSGPGGCEPYGVAVTLKRHGLFPQVHVSRDGPYFLDTTALLANKGDGVATLARIAGVDLREVAVLGDQFNDVAMFERAGLAIAMAQAPDAVKAKADHVSTSNDEDGVAHAIDTILLPMLKEQS